MSASTAATSASRSEARIPALDGVRGLAILLVLIWHYFVVDAHPEPGSFLDTLKGAFKLTFAGVDLFFVLSGFLIGGILIRYRGTENFFQVFYARRFARLMPIYMAMIALYVLLSPWLAANGTEAARWLLDGHSQTIPAWTYVLYLQNVTMAAIKDWGGEWLAVTWSLAIEEQFYLLAPLLVWLLPLRYLRATLLGLIVLSPILRTVALFATGGPMAAYVLLPCRWDALCIGMLIATQIHVYGYEARFRGNQSMLAAMLGLAFVTVAVITALGLGAASVPMATLGYTLLGLAAGAIIVAALYHDNPILQAVFANSALAWLGRVSYGVYILHQPVHGLVALAYDGRKPELSGPTDLALVLVALLLTCVVVELSYRYFEKPILDLGHRARYRSGAVASSTIASTG